MGHRDLQVWAWDIEGFTSWDSYPEALRVLAVDEEELPQPAPSRPSARSSAPWAA